MLFSKTELSGATKSSRLRVVAQSILTLAPAELMVCGKLTLPFSFPIAWSETAGEEAYPRTKTSAFPSRKEARWENMPTNLQ